MIKKSKRSGFKKRYVVLTIVAMLLIWISVKDMVICAIADNEFRFECYSTAEEIREELYRRYPVGSDLERLKNDLRNRGGSDDEGEENGKFVYGYDYPDGFLNAYGWGVTVIAEINSKKIEEIKVFRRIQIEM